MITNTLTRSSPVQTRKNKKAGFTLIEVIAVLVVLGILAAIALPRYVDMSENARERAIDAGIAELNGRESLVWANALISAEGFDADSPPEADRDLGADYEVAEDSITFQNGDAVSVTRTAATPTAPAFWSRDE